MFLPNGAVIDGEWVGDLVAAGNSSIIIREGARVEGRLEAARIYVAGEVLSPTGGPASILIGRQLIFASPQAVIDADMFSPSLALSRCKIKGMMGTLEDLREAQSSGRRRPRAVLPGGQSTTQPTDAAPTPQEQPRRKPPNPKRTRTGFFGGLLALFGVR